MCYLLPGQFADRQERFQICDWSGFGGRSPHYEIFTAEDRTTGEVVLLKVFPTVEWRESTSYEEDLDRIGQLEHPSLIPPLDFGPVPGDSCPIYSGPLAYVAERTEAGRTLEHYLDRGPDEKSIAPIFESIVEGFEYVRRRWRACDIPAREILLKPGSVVRWSLIGADSCLDGEPPVVVRALSHRYPRLAAP